MDQRPAHSWFAQLRRDRWLFAVVAALLLVLNALPAAHLQAGTAAVICTTDGAAPGGEQPDAERNCPICLTSASCFGGIAALGADTAGALAGPRSTRDQVPATADAGPPKAARHGIDSIRGPPFV